LDCEAKLDKFTLFFVFVPYTVHVILTILSLFNEGMFRISESNVYQRGPLYTYMALFMISYLFYASVRIFKKRKMLPKNEFYSLMIFPLPSIISGLIQMIFFGTSILWKAVSVGILIVFIKLQNVDMHMDHLTGLWNRRKLYQFFEGLSPDIISNKFLGGFMIDVDYFKEINDQYGHVVGDTVLTKVAQILKLTFNKDDFVSRYGGDEFIIILKVKSKDDLDACTVRLKNNLEEYNRSSKHPFAVSLSIGCEIMNSSHHMHFDHYIASLDKKMYDDKQSKRKILKD
jgi:diguanylate cyclase (GGDEF)-like protein